MNKSNSNADDVKATIANFSIGDKVKLKLASQDPRFAPRSMQRSRKSAISEGERGRIVVTMTSWICRPSIWDAGSAATEAILTRRSTSLSNPGYPGDGGSQRPL